MATSTASGHHVAVLAEPVVVSAGFGSCTSMGGNGIRCTQFEGGKVMFLLPVCDAPHGRVQIEDRGGRLPSSAPELHRDDPVPARTAPGCSWWPPMVPAFSAKPGTWALRRRSTATPKESPRIGRPERCQRA